MGFGQMRVACDRRTRVEENAELLEEHVHGERRRRGLTGINTAKLNSCSHIK